MLDLDDLIGGLIDIKDQRDSGLLPDSRKARGSVIKHIPASATCGNCSNMSYSGINEVTLYSGSCDEYKLSERFVNKSCDAACPFWRRRGQLKMQAEQVYSREVVAQIQNLNRSIQGRINVNTGKLIKATRPKALDEGKQKLKDDKVASALNDIGFFDMFSDGDSTPEESSSE